MPRGLFSGTSPLGTDPPSHPGGEQHRSVDAAYREDGVDGPPGPTPRRPGTGIIPPVDCPLAVGDAVSRPSGPPLLPTWIRHK